MILRCGKNRCLTGWAAVAAGSVILLSLILPRWFWWLVCGVTLLAGGVVLISRRS